jgi:type II secretory pathway pseudopilin PulG
MSANADDISDFVDKPSKYNKPGGQFRLIHLVAVLGIIVLVIALLLPLGRSAGPAAHRAQCTNNLKQIALALQNYETANDALPPAYTVDAVGRRLHSWRTLILPYLELSPLYNTIDLTKPWNDPANAEAYATEVLQYRCLAADFPEKHTSYLAIVAPDGCFLPDRPRRLSEITDDLGSTLMVIEVASDQSVHWMAPVDADESLVMGLGPRSKLNHAGGMNAALVNGSVRFLRAVIPAAERRAMISIAGHDDKAALAP